MPLKKEREAKMLKVLYPLFGAFFVLILAGCTKKSQQPKDVFFINLSSEPATLHPVSSKGAYASAVQSYVIEPLMIRDRDTYEHKPFLAERYTVSSDKTTYTFYLRKKAKFHDGTPVTAHDIKFYYDAVHDPKFEALNQIPYFEGFSSVKALSDHVLEVKTKNTYFGNFATMASLTAIPRHIYDNDKKNSKILVGSGAYKLAKYDKGRGIFLEKNPDWWGHNLPEFKDIYQMPKIHMRFIKDNNVQLEVFKKGQLDYLSMRAEDYVQRTDGAHWGKKYFKKKVKNLSSKGYNFIGWNLSNPLFTDVKVRRALVHLVNRRLMNKRFRFDMSLLATGPWYQQSVYAAKIPPLEFNPEKAKKLLKSAGWTDSDKDGVLDKTIDKKKVPFSFTLTFSNKQVEKYYTIYKEDLGKAGINMKLQVLEWNSFLKLLDEKKFEAVSLGWNGGAVDVDPKQIWHSNSRGEGGSNFIGYSNPEVDRLIDKGRMTLERKKRVEIFKKVYKKIAEDAPYVFLFNRVYDFYAIQGRVQQEKPTYRYTVGVDYWRLKSL